MSVNKVENIRMELRSHFIERGEEIDLALCALLSGSTMLMLGPPGTAKSQLIRAVASHVEGARYFEWLLTKFTTPEEIFGPLDLKDLEKGIFRRRADGKLPEAHVAFIDEIFKASSAILNSLLTILNERLYHNNGQPVRVPLIALYSASNELPEDECLCALYDRLLIRKVVEPVKDISAWERLACMPEGYIPQTLVSMQEIEMWRSAVSDMPVQPVLHDLLKIRLALRDKGVEISDRRFRQSIPIVKAYAFIRGARVPQTEHLEVLRHLWWEEPEQIPAVRTVVLEHTNPFSAKAVRYEEILKDFEARLKGKTDVDSDVLEVYNKVAALLKELQDTLRNAREQGKDTEEIEGVISRAEHLRRRIAKEILHVA